MPICHILLDAGHPENGTPQRVLRIKRIQTVLMKLGFATRNYGREICNDERSDNLETQAGTENGWQADFADRIDRQLKESVRQGDLIIATEAWHALCFRGMLEIHQGRFRGAPVVEFWIDYPHSFATYRIFSTRFAMYTTAASQARQGWISHWIAALPFYMAAPTPEGQLLSRDYDADPFSMEHMEDISKGIPVCAPDWGAWSETIKHGLSGMLYRSIGGHAKAREIVRSLPGPAIIEWVNETYSYEVTSKQVAGYLERLSNA